MQRRIDPKFSLSIFAIKEEICKNAASPSDVEVEWDAYCSQNVSQFKFPWKNTAGIKHLQRKVKRASEAGGIATAAGKGRHRMEVAEHTNQRDASLAFDTYE